jgi:hypothetical protein
MHKRLKEAGEHTCDKALVDLKGLRHLSWLDNRVTDKDRKQVPKTHMW